MAAGICMELSDIVVKRGSHIILHIEHVLISSGEFVGLIGPNGAGKTTFLKLCCGLTRPNQGTLRIDNRVISRRSLPGGGNFRKHIGYIPQQTEYNSHLPFTLREVVAMGRSGVKKLFRPLDAADYEKVDFWINEMGLYAHRRQTFRSLSGGQQQKALIARAMVAEPRLVLLDEPGANLDPNWKRQLRDILDKLFVKNRFTALLVSHELEMIPLSCRRVILLDQGRIVANGDKERVLDTDFNGRTNAGDRPGKQSWNRIFFP